jgi:hypothetical protein
MRARGWSQMDTNEKLEALQNDVNTALDMAEAQEKRLKLLEDAFGKLAQQVFAIRQHLGMS